MKAFLFSPSNQFKDKINLASKTNLAEELKIFLTNEKAEPYDYIECDGKTWTILSGDDGLELAEGKITRNSSAPVISSESETSSQQKPLKGFEQKTTESVGEKLDKLYDVMNHIRWIGLSIGCMLAITFFTPQCSGL
jgi:hypothetical protein